MLALSPRETRLGAGEEGEGIEKKQNKNRHRQQSGITRGRGEAGGGGGRRPGLGGLRPGQRADVLSCTLETCIDLLTNVTPIHPTTKLITCFEILARYPCRTQSSPGVGTLAYRTTWARCVYLKSYFN